MLWPVTKQELRFRGSAFGHTLGCYRRILIHFGKFCFFVSVTLMIDGSMKRNASLTRRLGVRMLLLGTILNLLK